MRRSDNMWDFTRPAFKVGKIFVSVGDHEQYCHLLALTIGRVPDYEKTKVNYSQ